jgi:hypothetical protein
MKTMIQSAYDAGSDIVVYIRGIQDVFRGTVRSIEQDTFTLFHNGCCNGMLWQFHFSDVLTVALVLPLPRELTIDCHFEADMSRSSDWAGPEEGATA